MTGEDCRLQTLEVDAEWQDPLEVIGVDEVVKIIWPLKLLPRNIHVKTSGFSNEVIELFSRDTVQVRKDLLDASKKFAASHLVEDNSLERSVVASWNIRHHCGKGEGPKKHVKLSHFKDYIGPDSGPRLAAFIDEVKNEDRHEQYANDPDPKSWDWVWHCEQHTWLRHGWKRYGWSRSLETQPRSRSQTI